jgi:hypothetical protein
MASLSTAELAKRSNLDIFLKRIKGGKPFTTANNGGKTVKIHKEYANLIKQVGLEAFKDKKGTILFETVNKSFSLPNTPKGYVRLSQLYKDSAFAGRTQKTTKAEDKEITSLNEQLVKIMDSTGYDYVKVKVGKNTYTVTSVTKTKGMPKADFNFVDTKGKPVGFISHKDGTSPKGFQQWSGTSQQNAKQIYNHKETQEFIKTLKGMFPDGMPNATTVGRKITSPKLKKMAVYGQDVGNGSTGVNNVDLVLQGPVKLKKVGSYYEVTSSFKPSIRGQYEPILLGVYKGDRSDHGIKGARITINPLGGRTVKEYV